MNPAGSPRSLLGGKCTSKILISTLMSSRPVTLFTGQWADLPCETMVQKAKEFGYDGLELACWGDHFEVDKADADYCAASASYSRATA